MNAFARFFFAFALLSGLASAPVARAQAMPAPGSLTLTPPAPKPLLPYVFQLSPGFPVAGPQGVKGDPGSPGPAGSPGMPGAGAGYSAALSGVLPNTAADQSPALASALTASKAAGSGLVSLPAGVLTLRSPLIIAATDSTGVGQFDGGTTLAGLGMNAQGGSPRGTTLQAGQAGMEAVAEMGPGFMVGGGLSQMTIKGFGPDGSTDTQHGWWAKESNWTNYRLDHVYFQNVKVAMETGYNVGNANGENLVVNQCLGQNVQVWYKNTSYQAYSHTEIASGASLNESKSASNYSTVYQLYGVGQNFLSIHGSGSFAVAPSNPLTVYNTFLEDQGVDQAVFEGGRYEHVGCIARLYGNTPAKISAVSINHYHFTDMVDGASIIQALGVNGQFNGTFNDCEFDSPQAGSANAPVATLNVLQMLGNAPGAILSLTGDPNGRYTFNRCRFPNFKTINLGAPPAAGAYPGVIYNDCWTCGQSGFLVPLSNVNSSGQAVLSASN